MPSTEMYHSQFFGPNEERSKINDVHFTLEKHQGRWKKEHEIKWRKWQMGTVEKDCEGNSMPYRGRCFEVQVRWILQAVWGGGVTRPYCPNPTSLWEAFPQSPNHHECQTHPLACRKSHLPPHTSPLELWGPSKSKRIIMVSVHLHQPPRSRALQGDPWPSPVHCAPS